MDQYLASPSVYKCSWNVMFPPNKQRGSGTWSTAGTLVQGYPCWWGEWEASGSRAHPAKRLRNPVLLFRLHLIFFILQCLGIKASQQMNNFTSKNISVY